MKKKLLSTTFGLLLVTIACTQEYSKGAALQAVLDRFTVNDLPGVGLAVYSETEGLWSGAAGFARKESKTPMSTSTVHYLQSVSKTFMAVAILQLYEQNKISLEAPITQYLPQKYARLILNAEAITVRMLLTHTSGIAEYISHPGYTANVLLNPKRAVPVAEMLSVLENEPAQFAPGARYSYTNTNYLLLALIGDQLTGDHGAFIRKNILQRLHMRHSWYDPKRMKMDYPGLPDSYWDILSTGKPANITAMQRANVAPLMGDDGVVATTTDAILFMRGLMEGKLLQPATLAMMQQWVKNDQGRPAYGLGLIHFDLDGIEAVGHGGGGLGAGCLLVYIPSKKLYVFLATNTGVVVDGLGGVKANEFKNAVMEVLLK